MKIQLRTALCFFLFLGTSFGSVELFAQVDPLRSDHCRSALDEANHRKVEPVAPSNPTRPAEDEYDKQQRGQRGQDTVEISDEARRRASGS